MRCRKRSLQNLNLWLCRTKLLENPNPCMCRKKIPNPCLLNQNLCPCWRTLLLKAKMKNFD